MLERILLCCPRMPHYTPLTSADLDHLRMHGDPGAQRAIEDIYRLGGDVRARLVAALAALDHNRDQLPAGLVPDSLMDLVRELDPVGTAPAGWDPDEIVRGGRFFEEYGMQVPLVLHLLSLPLTYSANQGVRVLDDTGQLLRNTRRRILGTAQLVLDTMSPDSLDPSGRGRLSALKVRLWHEVVRQQLQRNPQNAWDPAERLAEHPDVPVLGVPVNQEDMLGTLMAFSIVVLRGLRRLGAHFTDEEAQAYYHRWTAVGVMLGLQPAAIPPTIPEAERVWALIQQRHYRRGNRIGVNLTRALIDMLVKEVAPREMAEVMVPAMMRYLLAGESQPVADLLEVPAAGEFTQHVIGFLSDLFHHLDRTWDLHQGLRRPVEKLSMYLLHRVLVSERGTPHDEQWTLPPTLQRGWGIHDLRLPAVVSEAAPAPVPAPAPAPARAGTALSRPPLRRAAEPLTQADQRAG